ncbi:DNA/RNA helicase [Paenibacillus marinisediminis]
MREASIRFRFEDAGNAQLAYDMMRELNYTPVMEMDGHVFHIHLNRQDLTSALEIAAAYGGSLVEEGDVNERMVYDEAYGLDLIPIPAHLVNEDWAEDDQYARTTAALDDLSLRDEDAEGWNDEERTNHFPGGVHI